MAAAETPQPVRDTKRAVGSGGRLVTVALVLGVHVSSRPKPPLDGGLLLELHPHELIAQEVVRAVGPLEHLPPATRKAFDRSPLDPCPVCLRKLHVALGFDPKARYHALAEHYSRLGLHEAADWARQRWAFLRREAGR